MTEQEITTTPEVTEAVAAAPAEPKGKKVKKSATKNIAKKAKTKKSSPQTDEQKRLAKNAALREWRKKNADKFSAYMKTWRENKNKEAAKAARAEKSAAKKGAARE